MATKGKFFDLLAVQVAAGATVKAAAATAGCSESRAYTLSSQPEFRSRVSELRTEATTAAVGKLSAAASQAVDTLTEVMKNGSEAAKVNAAKAVLGNLLPLSESLELRERIDQLERSSELKVAG